MIETTPDTIITGNKVGNPGQLAAALLAGMRPKQWTKNLFVFIALVFTNQIPSSIGDPKWHNVGITILAFLLFCIISGSIYLANDVIDRDQDRLHEDKKNRPIASGRLPWQIALCASVIFGLSGVAASFLINTLFGMVALGYVGLQVAYILVLKHVVLLDVFAIAGGFVFRAIAGGFAISVPNSVWLLVCTLMLSLFLGFGKRRNELVLLAEEASNHRRNLAQYSLPFLDQLILISLCSLTVCYAIYSIMSPTAIQHPALWITLPNVIYGIFRYLFLIQIEHKGGSPETILLEDRPMQINLLLWVVEVIAALRISHPVV
jgi:4-hydroxybenzoate polyprenyltransferase